LPHVLSIDLVGVRRRAPGAFTDAFVDVDVVEALHYCSRLPSNLLICNWYAEDCW